MRKILLLFLVLALAVPFAACSGGGGVTTQETSGLPTGEQVYANAMAAMANVDTYQFDIDMTMTMSGEANGESIDYDINMTGDGAIDSKNEMAKTAMDMSMYMAIPGMDAGAYSVTTEMYIIGDMVYMMTGGTDISPAWTKTSATEDMWGQMNMTESQMELLDEAMTLEVTGVERVGGVECYVLEVTPDLARLWQVFLGQMGTTGGEDMFDVPVELLTQLFKDFSVKQWFAKDTYYLMRSDVEYSLYVTPELVGEEGEGEVTMNANMSLLAHGYNQPVSIVLPEEAKNAS